MFIKYYTILVGIYMFCSILYSVIGKFRDRGDRWKTIDRNLLLITVNVGIIAINVIVLLIMKLNS